MNKDQMKAALAARRKKKLQMNKANCDADRHHWAVFSTALAEGWLMCQCVDCGLHGTVEDPTKEEWNKAYSAPSQPYRWMDRSRVHVQDRQVKGFYVIRKVGGKKCQCAGILEPKEYERVPAEITRRGHE